jgi:hypothetical protein
MLLASASPAAAGSASTPEPIAPNESFVGVVNGQRGTATVEVTCDAPTGAGTMGHPVAGQTVEVHQVPGAPSPDPGYTGTAATAIGVGLGASTAVTPLVQLRVYDSPVQVPTSLVVPCRGTGVAVFDPEPGSPTAHAGLVKITFVSVP